MKRSSQIARRVLARCVSQNARHVPVGIGQLVTRGVRPDAPVQAFLGAAAEPRNVAHGVTTAGVGFVAEPSSGFVQSALHSARAEQLLGAKTRLQRDPAQQCGHRLVNLDVVGIVHV